MEAKPKQLSSSQYALRRKELLSLLKQLRATGSQGELDLPRITVIGNQSAGKSSVVEAISGITVPRDAGTCTRCPMECRLSSSSNSWTCQISIRREYDASGNVLDKVTEMKFGHVIIDKKDVEISLRRAQVAVLNPHIDSDDILKASAEKLTKAPFVSKQSLAFSRDTICIDLEGPELTDLAFIDLPGLIQNAEPQTIKLVEDMVVSHIKGNCLILVALPMTDDIENQKALRLARQEDPDGRRTIGVMTKPDMLTAGSTKAQEMWLDIIEGRRHPLVHGYYCTRQPDDAQREAEITPSEARTAESSFFASTPPWSNSTHKERFGTIHLISTLSRLLVGIINDTLPRIMSEAASKWDTCTRELAALPEGIQGDPATYMLKLLTGFCDEVQRSIFVGLDDSQLIHQNKNAYTAFKSAIRKSAPNFIPALISEVSKDTSADEFTKSKPFYLNDMREHIRQSVTRELPGNVPFSAKAVLITKFQIGWESAIDVCFTEVRKQVEDMLERQIKDTFYRYDHLEGHIRVFVSEIVQKHFDACSAILRPILLVETTPYTQNTHYLSTSHDKWLSIYKAARASKTAQPASAQQTPDQGFKFDFPRSQAPVNGTPKPKNAADSSQTTKTPVTPASAFPPLGNVFAAPANPFAAAAQAASPFGSLSSTPEDQYKQAQITQALTALSAIGYHGLKPEDLARLQPPDEYETELEIMAEVRGYFQVAYKRIIDNIPSMIDYMFVKAISNDMQSALISKLALGTADATERCSMYLAENPLVVTKRKELISRKKRLEEVKQALHTFGLA